MNTIKVTAYLNKRLKPKKNSKGENCYPVYLRFNYKGSNHQISSYSINYLATEKELIKYKKLIDIEINYINKFIIANNEKFELQKFQEYCNNKMLFKKDNFKLKLLDKELFKIKQLIEKRDNNFNTNTLTIEYQIKTEKLKEIYSDLTKVIENIDNWNN